MGDPDALCCAHGGFFVGDMYAVGQDSAIGVQSVSIVNVAITLVIGEQLLDQFDFGEILAHMSLDGKCLFFRNLSETSEEIGGAGGSETGRDDRCYKGEFWIDFADVIN